MKNLVLATASVLTLSMAGMGIGHAANTSNYNSANMGRYRTAQAQIPPANSQTENGPVRLTRNQLKQLQQELKSAGLYKGAVDGRMGRETKQAISQFQQQNGLNQTGMPDQQTLAALNKDNQNNQMGTGTSTPTTAQPSNGAGDLNSSQAPNKH